VPSDLGVRAASFLWPASDTVVVVYGRVIDSDGTASQETTPLVWNVHVQAPHALVPAVQTRLVRGAGPGFVELSTHGGSVRVDPATGAVLRLFSHQTPSGEWDSSGSRAAEVDTGNVDDGRGDPIVVRTIPSDDGPGETPAGVPSVDHAFAVYSWIDEDHLAALLHDGEPDDPTGVVLAGVDTATGQTTRLVTFESGNDETQLATDLLARPTVPGIEPPHPMDPREVTGIGVAIVLVALSAMIWWRRRVRP
jgi:hypothetical protein